MIRRWAGTQSAVAGSALALMWNACPAGAADRPAPPLAALQACRAIADNSQRLACFDAAAAEFDASVKAKDVVVIDRETLKKERARQFGRVKRDDPSFAAARVPEPRELRGKVLAVSPAAQFLLITVEGAGLWQTTEETFQPPRPGADVVISKGALGGYTMSYGGRAVRARRVG